MVSGLRLRCLIFGLDCGFVESRLLLVAESVVLSSTKKRRKRRESLLGTIFLSSLEGPSSSSAAPATWIDSMCAGVGWQMDSSEL